MNNAYDVAVEITDNEIKDVSAIARLVENYGNQRITTVAELESRPLKVVKLKLEKAEKERDNAHALALSDGEKLLDFKVMTDVARDLIIQLHVSDYTNSNGLNPQNLRDLIDLTLMVKEQTILCKHNTCACCHVPDLGACPTFEKGDNKRCVHCDHANWCHVKDHGKDGVHNRPT